MQSKQILGIVTLSIPPILSAQPPAGVKRVPPPPKNVPPLLQQYDFGGQLRTLEDPTTLPSTVTPELATASVSGVGRGACLALIRLSTRVRANCSAISNGINRRQATVA